MRIRKLSLLLTAILTLSIIFVSCEKQELKTENVSDTKHVFLNDFSVQVKQNYISFKTVE